MKKFIYCLIISFAFVFLIACQEKIPDRHYTSVNIGKTAIRAEVSDTKEERVTGLQLKDHLSDDEGMLFIYPKPAILSHWMKDMRIPLDMIWIDQNKTIIGIASDVPICKAAPCEVYSSNIPAQYVLEVNAGFAAAHHLKLGMKVSFT